MIIRACECARPAGSRRSGRHERSRQSFVRRRSVGHSPGAPGLLHCRHARHDLPEAAPRRPQRRNRRHQHLRPQLRRPLRGQRPCRRRPHRQDLDRPGALAARAAAAACLRPRRRPDRAGLSSRPPEISDAPHRPARLGPIRAHLVGRGARPRRERDAAHPRHATATPPSSTPRARATSRCCTAAASPSASSTSSAAARCCGPTCRPRPRSSPCA